MPLALAAPLAACTARTPAAGGPDTPVVLRLAHSLSDKHPTSVAIRGFADDLAERSSGRITVEIFASGQLGSEGAVIGQMRQGIIDLVRAASPSLASLHAGYHTFGLPFLFETEEDMHTVMDSPEMEDFYRSSADLGFIGLTHYTSGMRSFYTKSTPILTPEDLRGLKFRIQDMRSQTEMMKSLGGAPVVMSFGDTYTGLQTGLIDGAESNETVLTDSAHGEVAKVFSRTRHTCIPDVLLISSAAWERLSPEDRDLVVDAARASSLAHRDAWAESVAQAEEDAIAMGVEFLDDVDRTAFQEATAEVAQSFATEYAEVAELIDTIDRVLQEGSA
ncbi:TRAP transporter substrate-binding protein [Brachybacterium hainanense]|uniref:TRAP transporter substrate-binding protein n=1 Tax=Brachybacterium hainanense TaxID=1541174 RepID=A0ABV6R8T7_9MICO